MISGFTPEDIYIETDMHYITSTVPLTFSKPVTKLAIISDTKAEELLKMSRKVMQ